MVRGCDLAGRSCVPALQGHRHVCGHTQANAVPLPCVQAVLLGAHRYRIGQQQAAVEEVGDGPFILK